MRTILDHIVPEDNSIVKYGQVNQRMLLGLKMTVSLYQYIEVTTDYYDEVGSPYINNWTDVEGMGYGWIWTKYEEKDWHTMMSKIVFSESNKLLSHSENTLYFIYDSKDGRARTFHFVTLGDFREDTIFTFSKDEIFF